MKLMKKERKNLNLTRQSNRIGSHLGCVRVDGGESFEHFIMKAAVCYLLKKKGSKYLTEAITEKGRIDIMDLTGEKAIEVLQTEKKTSYRQKDYKLKKARIQTTNLKDQIKELKVLVKNEMEEKL